ncbi:MAG: hypothetical protein AB1451_01785 [Nitrospirota bacterium]
MIRAAHYRAGRGWDPQRPVLSERKGAVSRIEGSSETVVWNQGGGLYTTRYTQDYGWAVPVRIDRNAGTASLLRLTSDGPDRSLAAWVVVNGRSHDVVVREENAGDWQPSTVVDAGSGVVIGLDVAADRRGGVVVVWSRWEETGYRVVVRRSAINGWEEAWRLDDGLGDAIEPHVAALPDGSAVVIWRQFDGSAYSLYATHYDPATGWGSPKPIESHHDDAVYPDLCGDGKGNALAVWLERRCIERRCVESNGRIARYDAGAEGWSRAVRLVPGASDIKTACDATGRAIVIWVQNGAFGLPHIWSNRYDPVQGWGTPRPMKPDRRSSAHPAVAMNAQGAAVAVWEHFDLFSRRSLYGSWSAPQPN